MVEKPQTNPCNCLIRPQRGPALPFLVNYSYVNPGMSRRPPASYPVFKGKTAPDHRVVRGGFYALSGRFQVLCAWPVLSASPSARRNWMEIETSVPWPSSLSTLMEPPIASTIFWVIAIPMP